MASIVASLREQPFCGTPSSVSSWRGVSIPSSTASPTRGSIGDELHVVVDEADPGRVDAAVGEDDSGNLNSFGLHGRGLLGSPRLIMSLVDQPGGGTLVVAWDWWPPWSGAGGAWPGGMPGGGAGIGPELVAGRVEVAALGEVAEEVVQRASCRRSAGRSAWRIGARLWNASLIVRASHSLFGRAVLPASMRYSSWRHAVVDVAWSRRTGPTPRRPSGRAPAGRRRRSGGSGRRPPPWRDTRLIQASTCFRMSSGRTFMFWLRSWPPGPMRIWVCPCSPYISSVRPTRLSKLCLDGLDHLPDVAVDLGMLEELDQLA